MTTRSLPAIYRAVAEAVKETPMVNDAKCLLVKNMCTKLKANDARFAPAQFSEACWSKEEW